MKTSNAEYVCTVPTGYEVTFFRGVAYAFSPTGISLFLNMDTREWTGVFSGKTLREYEEEKLALLGPVLG